MSLSLKVRLHRFLRNRIYRSFFLHNEHKLSKQLQHQIQAYTLILIFKRLVVLTGFPVTAMTLPSG